MHDPKRFLVAGVMHTRADASATVHARTVPTTFAAIIAVAWKTMTNTKTMQTLQLHRRGQEETNNKDMDLTVLCPGTNAMCLRSTLLGQSDPATFGIRIRPILGPLWAKVGTCVNNKQKNKYEYLPARSQNKQNSPD